jgi:hypothetical protein
MQWVRRLLSTLRRRPRGAAGQPHAAVWRYSNSDVGTLEWRWLGSQANVGADGFLSEAAATADAEEHGYAVQG